MKANELMIGDRVQGFLPDTYSQVYGVINECRVAIVGRGAYMEVSNEDIQPIPITTEILEKNGYVKDEDIRGYVSFCHRIIFHYEDEFKNTGNSWYVHVDNNCFDSIGSIEVTYVHQFQQFLRLCGYSEMAEEFKV